MDERQCAAVLPQEARVPFPAHSRVLGANGNGEPGLYPQAETGSAWRPGGRERSGSWLLAVPESSATVSGCVVLLICVLDFYVCKN